jgi:hypothetical protein
MYVVVHYHVVLVCVSELMLYLWVVRRMLCSYFFLECRGAETQAVISQTD